MIKRIAGVLLFITVISAHTGYGQRIMGAAIVGLNATQVDGDEVYGYKNFGLNAGLSAIVPFNNKWSVSIENIYSEKGAHQRVKYLDSLDGSYDQSMKEYRPGPRTKVLGGVATGVKKQAEVAKPTPIRSGAGLQPNNTPTSRAIGANNAAVAVLDIKFVTMTLTIMRAINTA